MLNDEPDTRTRDDNHAELVLPSLRLTRPELISRADARAMQSTLAQLVASGQASSRAELTASTGLARSTVSSYVQQLIQRGILDELGSRSAGARGRPADALGVNPAAGVVVTIDLGARHSTVAIANLGQSILANRSEKIDVRNGPDSVMTQVYATCDRLLGELREPQTVRAVVMGVPARVDTEAGVPVRPNLMPNWDGYPLAKQLSSRFDCPALLENDCNLRAMGEAAALGENERPIIAIKVATGIGAGIVDQYGKIFHGFDGAAGDFGHTRLSGALQVPCSCGSIGCIEAVASVSAIIRRLSLEDQGLADGDEITVQHLIDRIRSQEPAAVAAVNDAAAAIGGAVALLCNILNPKRIVLGGDLTTVTDELLAGVRAVAYRTARPLATRNVVIGHSVLGEAAGIAGALVMAIELALSPEQLGAYSRAAPKPQRPNRPLSRPQRAERK